MRWLHYSYISETEIIFFFSFFYYMSCISENCKFNLHMACFNLPLNLPSLPLHYRDDHNLILRSPDKLKFDDEDCSVCKYPSNGLYYACAKCSFKADIKCAVMPETIYHAAHPQHPIKFTSINTNNLICHAGCSFPTPNWYACGICDFAVHVGCAVLPASVRSRRWDRQHPQLLLTYNANLNHLGDFYCNECEQKMNPKSWMYRCTHCDISFHPLCFPLTSGWHRNVKFGQQYVIPRGHSHTLTYQLLAQKLRCDICHEDKLGCPGFYCASCNFFVCFYDCGQEMVEHGGIESVD